MQVGPGADDAGIDLGVADDFLPRGEGPGGRELGVDGGGRLGPAVANGDDLDAGDGPQTRNVTAACVGARADESDTEEMRRSGHRGGPRRVPGRAGDRPTSLLYEIASPQSEPLAALPPAPLPL